MFIPAVSGVKNRWNRPERNKSVSTKIALGLQWGDEGKGKIIDFLSEDVDLVVRAAGGANAGHTIKAGGIKYVLHLIPSGIVHPDVRCLLGSGMVIDPDSLLDEVLSLEKSGISDVRTRTGISGGAHLILSWHTEVEKNRENSSRPVGTTLRGIGPCYESRASRYGIPVSYLKYPDLLGEALNDLYHSMDIRSEINPELMKKTLLENHSWIIPMICDVSLEVHNAQKNNMRILMEGAQGVLLDGVHGTYPYVTSSQTVTGGIYSGVGVGPQDDDCVIGIVKAYTTRVGNGPFPTELKDSMGEFIARAGNEFGATTGRPRRCGWLDMVALRYAVRITGVKKLALTKVDVLDGLDDVFICNSYKNDKGDTITDFPPSGVELDKMTPVYESFSGWESSGINNISENLYSYIRTIEDLSGVEVSIISFGPDRLETVLREDFSGFLR